MDVLGVVPCDRAIAVEAGEQPGAGIGDLVQRETGAGEFGEDRQQARSGRGFEDEIVRSDRRGFGGGEAQRDRRRELLEAVAFLRAAGLRRQPLAEPVQHLEHRGGGAGAGSHGTAEFAQEQHLRRLGGFVGILPGPGAGRIRGAERRLHRRAQGPAVEGAALPEQAREFGCGMKKPRNPVGGRGGGEQRQHRGPGRGGRGGKHGRSPGRAAGRAPETPHAVRGKVRRSALVPFPDLNSPLWPFPSPRSGRSAGDLTRNGPGGAMPPAGCLWQR